MGEVQSGRLDIRQRRAPSQSKPVGFASSPKGRAKSTAGNFAVTTKSRPLGEGGIAAGDDGRGNPTAKNLEKKMSKSVDKRPGVWYYT